MACFVVPAAEGAVVKVIEQKAKKSGENTEACARRVERLGRLSKMLWGGLCAVANAIERRAAAEQAPALEA